MNWKDCLQHYCIKFALYFFIIFVLVGSFVGFFCCVFTDNTIMGEKIMHEDKFTIIDKNEYRSIFRHKTSFVLESDTKERYVVYVPYTIYQLYYVNDKIKVTFDTYSKSNRVSNFKIEGIEGIVANE